MILDLNKYNRFEVVINENFKIKVIKFIEHKQCVHGIKQYKLIIDLDKNVFSGYISASLINKDRLEFLDTEHKLKCRTIFKNYYQWDFLDTLFIKDIQNIIISFLII